MRPARIILLLVALLAGGLAAILVMGGSGSDVPEQASVPQVVAEPKTQVLVASAPIGVGQRLGPETVQWQEWPESALRPEYVTVAAMPDAPAELTGAVARFEIFPGEPIRDAKLVRADQGYLSAVLGEGMRGVSVGVTAVSSAGGFIVPNDHVDVVLTTEGALGEQSEVVLSNVRVLAIGHRLGEIGTTSGAEDPSQTSPSPQLFDAATIATLELTPRQAETLISASVQGQLTLTLRSVVDFSKGPDTERQASSQTVRLIRFGREQAVLAGETAVANASVTPVPAPGALQPVAQPQFSSPTPAEPVAPALLPQ